MQTNKVVIDFKLVTIVNCEIQLISLSKVESQQKMNYLKFKRCYLQYIHTIRKKDYDYMNRFMKNSESENKFGLLMIISYLKHSFIYMNMYACVTESSQFLNKNCQTCRKSYDGTMAGRAAVVKFTCGITLPFTIV
jgi:hypothetical protein